MQTPHCSNCAAYSNFCEYAIPRAGEPCEYHKNIINNSNFFSHFFTWRGRINRTQYLVSTLVLIPIIVYVLAFILSYISFIIFGTDAIDLTSIILLMVLGFGIYMNLTMAIKRCHDIGESTTWAYLSIFIGCISWIFLLKRGEIEPNDYGTVPLKSYYKQLKELKATFDSYNLEPTQVE